MTDRIEKTKKALNEEVEELWNYIAHVYAVDADDDADVKKEYDNLLGQGYLAMAEDLESEVDEYKALKLQMTNPALA